MSTSVNTIVTEILDGDMSLDDKNYLLNFIDRLLDGFIGDQEDDVDKDMLLLALSDTRKEIETAKRDRGLAENQDWAFRRERVVLHDRDPRRGVCVSFRSKDLGKIESFKALANTNLPRSTMPWHIINHRDVQVFECWTPNILLIRGVVEFIAGELGVKFDTDIIKTYPVPKNSGDETVQPLEFAIENHVYNDFDK